MMQRWNDHVYAAKYSKNGRWHFPNAIRKYGRDAFSHEILEVCDTLESANLAEEKWIKFHNTRNPQFGFNLAKGGEHTPHQNTNPWNRPEYREKACLAAKAKWQDPEYRANNLQRFIDAGQTPEARACLRAAMNTMESKEKRSAISKTEWQNSEYRTKCCLAAKAKWDKPGFREHASAVLKGIPLKPDHCAKLSVAGKGKSASPETRKKLSLSQKGKPRNADSIAKSAASRKGIKFSPEHRAKIGDAHRGKRHSPEHIAKVAMALKNRPKQVYCKRGHLLENAYTVNGTRICRTCHSLRRKQYRTQQKNVGKYETKFIEDSFIAESSQEN